MTTLASHGFKRRCEVCHRQTHAKWHEYARCEANPVALIEFVERHRASAPAVCDAIVGYIYAVTAMDVEAMRAALLAETPPKETP